MSYFYPLLALSFITRIFGSIAAPSDSELQAKTTVYESQMMQMVVPDHPLTIGSLKVESKSRSLNVSEWEAENILESYGLIQKVVEVWRKNGITDYLIYAKESTSLTSFSYEVVPYPKKGWRFWKQFKTLWNIIFGSSALSEIQRSKIARDFKQLTLTSNDTISEIEQISIQDAFCDQSVIERQLVYAGKKINILYNYAPIGFGQRKLHFLLVPKEHRLTFSDLSQEEYLEVVQLCQKLISFYKEKEFKAVYLFNKSGTEAGQSVLHWHEHVVFTATKTQELFGKLTILKNMLFGSSPLSKQELQTQVELLRNELGQL